MLISAKWKHKSSIHIGFIVFNGGVTTFLAKSVYIYTTQIKVFLHIPLFTYSKFGRFNRSKIDGAKVAGDLRRHDAHAASLQWFLFERWMPPLLIWNNNRMG